MKKRAFLFGINEYNAIARLRFARQDAESVARALREGYDFKENEIVLCTCESEFKPMAKSSVFRTLRWSEPLDLLIVGFWGHGVWRDGKRFLCPMSAEVESLDETAVSLEELRDAIQRIPAKQVCILLDCCQSRLEVARNVEAPPLENGARDIILNTFQEKTSSVVPDQTVAVLNSCSEGQRAYEWEEKGHGFFTVHLLEELGKRESNVATIFKYVREETRKSSRDRQSPFFECRGGSEILLPAVPMKTFYVPENPNDVKIVTNYEIGEIHVTVQRVEVPRGTQPRALPAIPEVLRRYQSELAGINQAIQQLQDGTHPALDSAKRAVAEVRSQVEALSLKRNAAFQKLMNPALCETLRLQIVGNPDTSVGTLFELCPEGTNQTFFMSAALWEKHVTRARWECYRVENEYRTRCQGEILKLNNRKNHITEAISSENARFLKETMVTLLSASSGYDTLSAPFPESEMESRLPLLLKYELGWDLKTIWKSAEQYWMEERPAIRETFLAAQEARRREQEAAQAKFEAEEQVRRRKVWWRTFLKRHFAFYLGSAIGFVLCTGIFGNFEFGLRTISQAWFIGSLGFLFYWLCCQSLKCPENISAFSICPHFVYWTTYLFWGGVGINLISDTKGGLTGRVTTLLISLGIILTLGIIFRIAATQMTFQSELDASEES